MGCESAARKNCQLKCHKGDTGAATLFQTHAGEYGNRKRSSSKAKRRIAICLVLWLLAGAVPALADTIINIDRNGNGISLTHQSGGGQYISFSNLAVSAVATRRTMLARVPSLQMILG